MSGCFPLNKVWIDWLFSCLLLLISKLGIGGTSHPFAGEGNRVLILLYPVLKFCKIFVKVHLFVEKSNPKPVQNQLLDWMPKNHFQINQLPKKQFLGVKKQLLSVKNQLLDSKKFVLGKSTGWSKESFGHPIQKLVLDRFWVTFFDEEMHLFSIPCFKILWNFW